MDEVNAGYRWCVSQQMRVPKAKASRMSISRLQSSEGKSSGDDALVYRPIRPQVRKHVIHAGSLKQLAYVHPLNGLFTREWLIDYQID